MEGLMSEATDLVLSPRPDDVIGPNKVLTRESGKVTETPQDSRSLSSVSLLRLSIANSIKDRGTEVEVPRDKISKTIKNKRRKDPFTRSPKADIQFLNSELATLHPERKASSADEIDSPLEQNKSNITTKMFTELLNSSQAPDPEMTGNKEDDTDNYKKNEVSLEDEEQKKRQKIAVNGLKLASRKFSDGIFENCSTYSLACPELLQDRENIIPPNQDAVVNEEPPAGSLPKTHDIGHYDEKKSTIADNDSCTEDQISLSDSFFFDVTSEESGPQSYFFHKEGENSSAKRNSVKGSLSKEIDPAVPEDNLHSSGALKRERRLSKKLRKRNKKTKSKDIPTYECPKCGVQYILSSKTSESTARCLHCDFWTSVEPEFVKREKQPWNTCRIC